MGRIIKHTGLEVCGFVLVIRSSPECKLFQKKIFLKASCKYFPSIHENSTLLIIHLLRHNPGFTSCCSKFLFHFLLQCFFCSNKFEVCVVCGVINITFKWAAESVLLLCEEMVLLSWTLLLFLLPLIFFNFYYFHTFTKSLLLHTIGVKWGATDRGNSTWFESET